MKRLYWIITVFFITIGTLSIPANTFGTEVTQPTTDSTQQQPDTEVPEVPQVVKKQPSLNYSEVTLQVGKSKKLKLKNAKKKVKWSSSKTSVARVNSKGVVTATGIGKATITAKMGKKKYTCQVFGYKVEYYHEKVAKKAASVIQKNIKASMSEVEMIKAIHDYMVLNCAYDYKNYLKGTIPWVSYTPEGLLIKKKAVCQGYAETFQLFMNSMGFPCHLVRGTANGGGHAWNCVKVDKKWYQIDVTWDDPVPDKKGRTRYAYFLIPDSKMDDDHFWDKSPYPKCKTKSNKFIYLFGEVSNNKEEAMEALYKQYMSGATRLQLIYPTKYWKSQNCQVPFFDMLREYNIEGPYTYSYTRFEYGKYHVFELYW